MGEVYFQLEASYYMGGPRNVPYITSWIFKGAAAAPSANPVLEFAPYNNGWDTAWVPAASGVRYNLRDLPIAEQLLFTWEELKSAITTFDPENPPELDIPEDWKGFHGQED